MPPPELLALIPHSQWMDSRDHVLVLKTCQNQLQNDTFSGRVGDFLDEYTILPCSHRSPGVSVRSSRGGVFGSWGRSGHHRVCICARNVASVIPACPGGSGRLQGSGTKQMFFLFQSKEWTEHLADSSELRKTEETRVNHFITLVGGGTFSHHGSNSYLSQ